MQMTQVAKALTHLHARGVVHGHIHPVSSPPLDLRITSFSLQPQGHHSHQRRRQRYTDPYRRVYGSKGSPPLVHPVHPTARVICVSRTRVREDGGSLHTHQGDGRLRLWFHPLYGTFDRRHHDIFSP